MASPAKVDVLPKGFQGRPVDPVAPTPLTPSAPPREKADIAERMIIRWRHSPLAFVMEALLPGRARPIRPTAQQVQILTAVGNIVSAKIRKFEIQLAKEAVARGVATAEQRLVANARLTDEQKYYARLTGVSIKSGKGIGKDTVLAWLTIWFNMTMPDEMKSLLTASTFNQLSDVLWAEVAKWFHGTDNLGNYVVPGHDDYTLGVDKFYLTALNGRKHFISARTAREGRAAQAGPLRGYHEDYVFLGLDEASDIPDPTFESLIGTLTGPVNIAVIVFNPIYSTGYAARTHLVEEERKNWVLFTMNAEESPLVTRASIEKMRARGGRDSNLYRVNVLGEFPKSESDVLIPYEYVRAAVTRSKFPAEFLAASPKDENHRPYVVLGIDVAGEGADESIICVRSDNQVLEYLSNSSVESPELVEWILEVIEKTDPDDVAIDATGLGWVVAGFVAQRFRRLVQVKFNAKAKDEEHFANKRAEIYEFLRVAFVDEQSIMLPYDPKTGVDEYLLQEFSSIKKKPEGKKTMLVPKREIKAELGFSPDRADATALTYVFRAHYKNTRQERDPYDVQTRVARRPHWTCR